MKNLYFKIYFSVLFAGLSQSNAQLLPYLDESVSCFNQSQADQYVNDFNINVKSFGGAELCNGRSDFKKLINDLSVIEAGRFQKSPQQGLIGNFVDSDKYYSWVSQQTRGMTRGMDNPVATAYNAGGYFTMQNAWANLSTLGRVGVLIHEARHSQGYYHERCKFGPYSDTRTSGCDKDFSSGGAHAIEMEYYARVSTQGQNFHPVYKAMARLMAMARSNFIFNKSPLIKREGLVVQSDVGEYWIYDQGKWINRPAMTPNGNPVGILKRTSAGVSVLASDRAYSVDLYEGVEPISPLTDTYSYFKIFLESKYNISDAEEFDIGSKRHLILINKSNQFSSYNFGLGGWNKAQTLAFKVATTSPYLVDGKRGYFLIDPSGAIYSYEPKKNNFKRLQSKWDFYLKSVSNVNGQVYSLTNDNKLFSLTNGQWVEFHLPKGQKPVQIASAPLYNIFSILE